ncbi:S-layer protein [Anaerosporomusa subterranea]|uniref:S-layer protein n=1 Tax=Anaerosporomusa subterranea TaxID=1794912 RepID=A0A154BR07_ANASB|nr:S-layer homology domain-containing protein [Anaerosporomusa subterranea]KYZ76397.1 S-layer protein [Anaerosporomusa subterranea]
MKKSLLRAAITTALTVAFAVPAFANPFSDVPSNHWAYKAVNDLQKAGIVEGYNGKFDGSKNMTRYEMAQIVAKAMTKAQTDDQKGTVDKLSKEFAVELMNLGVKVDGLEKKVDNMVKVSGDARVRYFDTDNSDANDAGSITDYRARVSFDGKINDNMKFNARLSSGNADAEGASKGINLDTANVTFKTYALENTVGRQDIKLGSGYIMDAQMNGLASKVGGLKVFGGNATQNFSTTKDANQVETVYGAEYAMNLGGAKITADYLNNADTDEEIYGANISGKIMNGVTATAEYFKNNDLDADSKAYGVKLNKLGLSATYRDVEAGGLTAYSALNNNHFNEAMNEGGFKGMEYQLDRELAKNTVLTVKHQDFEKQDGAELAGRTSAVVNVKF